MSTEDKRSTHQEVVGDEDGRMGGEAEGEDSVGDVRRQPRVAVQLGEDREDDGTPAGQLKACRDWDGVVSGEMVPVLRWRRGTPLDEVETSAYDGPVDLGLEVFRLLLVAKRLCVPHDRGEREENERPALERSRRGGRRGLDRDGEVAPVEELREFLGPVASDASTASPARTLRRRRP